MIRLAALFILTCCLSQILMGQDQKPKIYQLSGMIISQQGQEPITYVQIQLNHTRRGTLTNEDGFYSIPVTSGDTLYFTHLGFDQEIFVVADYLKKYKQESIYLYAINYMKEDTFTLPVVNIFPYDTPEELKTAILNMDPEGTPAAIARANLSPEVLDAIIQTLPVDAGERMTVGRQMYYDYYKEHQLLKTASIDPLSALRLLQYVVQKVKKKKARDLNYWE